MAQQLRKTVDEELTTHEWQRARAAYSKVLCDKRWVTSNFELQNICAELGLQPTLEEIERAITANDNNMDFEGLLRFVSYMKVKFHTPDPDDMDTVLCFVAVGGAMDKTGEVEADILKQTCQRFNLAIDIERMIDQRTATQSAAGQDAKALNFREFEDIFDAAVHGGDAETGTDLDASSPEADELLDATRHGPSRLNLGLDYQQLLAREMGERGLPLPRARRPTDLLGPMGRGGSMRAPQQGGKRASAANALQPTRPPGDPGARGRTAPAGGHRPGGRQHMELRAKGVPAALYGGVELGEQIESPEAVPKMPGIKSPSSRKRRLQPAPPGQAALNKSSPQAILGANTRIFGRTGLFVDDPPRLYPQHQAAAPHAAVPTLPPVNGVMTPRDRARQAKEQAEKSPIVQSIERRIEELGKRKLGSKYRNVTSRWNEGTLSARGVQPPKESPRANCGINKNAPPFIAGSVSPPRTAASR